MKLLDSLRFRMATLFQRSQVNAEMDDELRSHIQLRADDLEHSGVETVELVAVKIPPILERQPRGRRSDRDGWTI